MWAGKTKPLARPNFSYKDANIKLAKAHKLLGVHLDEELCWNIQAEKVMAKAAKWNHLYPNVSKHGHRAGIIELLNEILKSLTCFLSLPTPNRGTPPPRCQEVL